MNNRSHSFLFPRQILGVVAKASAKLQINFKLMKIHAPELNLTDFMQEEEIVVPTFWFSTVSNFSFRFLVQFLQE